MTRVAGHERANERHRYRPASHLFAILAFLAVLGCVPTDPTASAPGLAVETFNYAGLDAVPLNGPLVLTLTHEVNPHSVNRDTIQIWTTLHGRRHRAHGTFDTSGRIVTWFPHMTSHAVPAAPASGRGENPLAPLLPEDAGLNTNAVGIDYEVVIPAPPNPNTIRSARDNRPITEAYSATFRTVPAPPSPRAVHPEQVRPLFSRSVPFFRDSIRVADVLAYCPEYSAWLRSPDITGGENPLFLNPALLDAARAAWQGREVTGEWVDQVFGIQLTPRLTEADLTGNAFPAGMALKDERLISNRRGIRRGRTREVTAVHIYLSQAVVPNPFLSNGPASDRPPVVQIRVLTDPSDDPSTTAPEPISLSYVNVPDLHTGLVTATLSEPIRKGWIHITIDPSLVTGLPGGQLESNLGPRWFAIWPVEIRAE